MKCPAEVAAVIYEILQVGLLQCRAAAWAGDAARCAIEADHLHNLPSLLHDFTPDGLAYYWDVERPSYEDNSASKQAGPFRPLWERLQPHVERHCATTKP